MTVFTLTGTMSSYSRSSRRSASCPIRSRCERSEAARYLLVKLLIAAQNDGVLGAVGKSRPQKEPTWQGLLVPKC